MDDRDSGFWWHHAFAKARRKTRREEIFCLPSRLPSRSSRLRGCVSSIDIEPPLFQSVGARRTRERKSATFFFTPRRVCHRDRTCSNLHRAGHVLLKEWSHLHAP